MRAPGQKAILTKIDTFRIAYSFARIKDDRAVVKFAKQFGLLGLHTANELIQNDYLRYMMSYYLSEPAEFEHIHQWFIHADHVRKLLKLHQAISAKESIEDDLIRVEQLRSTPLGNYDLFVDAVRHSLSGKPLTMGSRNQFVHDYYEKRAARANDAKAMIDALERFKNGNQGSNSSTLESESQKINQSYFYHWSDGKPTMLPFIEVVPEDDEGYRVIGKMILHLHLREMLGNAVFLDYSHVTSELPLKEASDLKFDAAKASNYLLTAIYYDVLRIVNNHERTGTCKVCGNAYPMLRNDAKYCGSACRVEMFRRESKMKGAMTHGVD